MNTSKTLFLSTVTERNKLDDNIQNSESFSTLKKSLNLSDQFLLVPFVRRNQHQSTLLNRNGK